MRAKIEYSRCIGDVGKKLRRRVELIDVSGCKFDRNLHLARVESKRMRAALKLVKPLLGCVAFQLQMGRIKRASGLLSEQRDSMIISKELSKVGVEIASGISKQRRTGDQALQLRRLPAVKSALLRSATFLERNGVCDTREVQHAALGESARTMIRHFKRVRRHGKAADFHRWRKAVKTVFFQLQLADGQRKAGVALIKQLDALQKILGKAHDVEITRKFLREHQGDARADVEKAFKRLKKKQRCLEEKALKLGAAFRDARNVIRPFCDKNAG